MPSMTRNQSLKRTAVILSGLTLSAALAGCHTTGHQKDHQHTQPEMRTGKNDAEPSSSAPTQVKEAPAQPSPSKARMTITVEPAEADGEKSRVEARMPAGGSLTIQLPFQAGTGYNWALSSISSDLKMMSQTTRSLSDDGRSGGPMLAVYVLECLSDDSVQTARFELSRPWETDTPPVRDVVLLVNGSSTDSKE